MSWLDWALIGILSLSIISGFRFGLVRALLGTLKYFISFVLILLYAPRLGEFLVSPWNLTQNIALSINDMVNLPGNLYTQSIDISKLSQLISLDEIPLDQFVSSLKYIISQLELPQILRDILTSLFNQESIREYLLQVSPEFSNFPIDNLEGLACYTLGSFIAKLIAISIGSLVIIIVSVFLTQFFISLFHKMTAAKKEVNLTYRLLGSLFNFGICFFVLVLVVEVITPLLCYLMIDPTQSLMLSVIMNTSFHIRPWLEHAVLHM